MNHKELMVKFCLIEETMDLSRTYFFSFNSIALFLIFSVDFCIIVF